MPRTSRRVSAKAIERQEIALRLYIAGQSYETIAKAAGFTSRATAYNAVTSAIKRHAAEREGLAEDAMTIALERYEALFRLQFKKALDGDTPAALAAKSIQDKIGKLQGLDAPTQVNLQIRSELDAQIEELMADLSDAPQQRTFDGAP